MIEGGVDWTFRLGRHEMGNPSPKRNRFPVQESSRTGTIKGREAECTGERGKSLGGLELKVENEGSSRFLGEMLPSCFKSYLWSRVRGACLPACKAAAFPPLSHLCYFPTCFRISLHPSRPQTVEFGCASSHPALQHRLELAVFCSFWAEGCSLCLNSLSWEIFFNWTGVFKVSSFQPQTRCNNTLFLLRNEMRDKDHSRHLLPRFGVFFLKARLAFLSSYVQSSLKPCVSKVSVQGFPGLRANA